jgi:hypothetical protein
MRAITERERERELKHDGIKTFFPSSCVGTEELKKPAENINLTYRVNIE